MQQLVGIQVLRGIAALSVVLYHATGLVAKSGYEPLFGFFQIGSRGVQLFFALSGFIIYYAHYHDIGRPARFGRYLYRRFTRIYPTLWVVWVVSAVGYAAGYHPEKAFKLAVPNLIKSFFVYPLPPDHYIVNASWTLTWEMAFYLVFSVMVLNRRIGLAAMLLWEAAVVFANVLQPELPQDLSVLLDPNVFFFLPGMGAAWLFLNRGRFSWLRNVAVAKLLVAVGAFAFIFEVLIHIGYENPDFRISGPLDIVWLCSFYLAPCLVVLGTAIWEVEGSLKPRRIWLTLGAASYSIYLVHDQQLGIMTSLLRPWPAILGTDATYLAICAIAVAIGIVFYQLVEKPLIRFFAELGGHRRAVKPAAAAE